MKRQFARWGVAVAAVLGGWSTLVSSQPESPAYHAHVYAPPHVSEQWRQFFADFKPFWKTPHPNDLDGWQKWDASKQALFIERDTPLIEQHQVTLREFTVDGVRVVEITPKAVNHDDKALLYLHGGGWASFSPESTWIDTVPMAAKLGVRVYSVDYTKAPAATLYDILDEAVAVFEHLIVQRDLEPQNIGLYGCSAGGHLSLATSNAVRNRGMGVPGAVVAGSPMIDFTMSNDTWITLEGQDPAVSRESYVRQVIDILGIKNLRDPVISPQYDDNLADGMPPTLLQTGGKEVLLSDSLVMFQTLEAAGQVAKLDIYDGMPHCFSFVFPDSPEGVAAYAKQVSWFREHLNLK